MFQRSKRNQSQRRRRAVAAVEFAVIAPLMMLFTFGLVEMGRFMLVKEAATHATREGARMAVRPSATSEEVIDRVNQELAIMSIEGATVEVVPAELEAAEPGAFVTVTVRIAPESISWVPGFIDINGAMITAESMMRRESTN